MPHTDDICANMDMSLWRRDLRDFIASMSLQAARWRLHISRTTCPLEHSTVTHIGIVLLSHQPFSISPWIALLQCQHNRVQCVCATRDSYLYVVFSNGTTVHTWARGSWGTCLPAICLLWRCVCVEQKSISPTARAWRRGYRRRQ